MNCPVCLTPLTFKEREPKGGPRYYEVECQNPYCLDDGENTRFWGFAEYPSQRINDYEINIVVDGKSYDFTSYNDGWSYSEIWQPGQSANQCITLDNQFYPVADDISFYENLVRRILNLKVFL
jgi:hypothetical protein